MDETEYFYVTYNNMLSYCCFELNKIDNVKKFCDENDIDIQIAYRIKNGTSRTKYTKVVIKILTLCGYSVSQDKLYKIKKP